jgi:membrane-bound lytic murein transglycosylase MltF
MKILRYTVITALIIIACPLYESGHTRTESAIDMFHFSGKTLICGIDLGDDMKGTHGLETGFAYETLKDFARDHNCTIKVITADKDSDFQTALKEGKIDLLLTHHENVQTDADILLSENLIDCSALAVRNGKDGEIREINEWISTYTSSEEFQANHELFFRAFNPIKRAEKGIIAQSVSPYDELIKQYAETLGWDWRMLAAVVYQESKFSISSRSHRGATGLMQVMPQTARYYNITDLTDPEQNLIAGTSHLKRLQGLYRGCDMTPEERIHFTLAAYNAGEGRIQDCRSLAKSKNLDENKWSDIVQVIPLMNDDTILEDENVKLGKFKGTETIGYVDNVMALYEAICKISPR